MQEITFRNASLEDLPKIVEIYNSTIPSRMVTADTEPVSVESRKQWFAEHNAETRPLWIIEDQQNKILGWVSFSSFYGRPAYNGTVELSIYMDESCRGKGYGKKVLQYCIDNAGKFGVKTLLGFIFLHNEPSLKLFRHFGFEDWGVFPDVAVLDGVERTLVILGKRIE
ncbi:MULTISPECIES: GNAT family N-acetyltransferase [Chryseobacterium]|uniref:Phosphinothricin acetyltransferase n=1 Tax=Chryseobacterium geocarposphaerae TaxID=1416776 RepID=A0ABU1LGC1_9FLAO|nr:MULTISPECIES: GNAT family N-acetyltransferase [Chryseobacterium]MDR6405635.1 phosphinothricin acetyltransferase [Chryseobacterium geocarposphaerae]MDR6698866.1 phosphinothricin acetyltransferase [Chryseobacterium ginsenosidimutans]